MKAQLHNPIHCTLQRSRISVARATRSHGASTCISQSLGLNKHRTDNQCSTLQRKLPGLLVWWFDKTVTFDSINNLRFKQPMLLDAYQSVWSVGSETQKNHLNKQTQQHRVVYFTKFGFILANIRQILSRLRSRPIRAGT